jgi:ZIP family zinc transporter
VAAVLPFVLALAAAGPRLLGGFAVLRGRDRLHIALGFAGGALLGVACLETLPEAVELLGGLPAAAVIAAGGAAGFLALERTIFGHVHQEDAECNPLAGHIGAGGLSVHAFLDGLAIGAAFQVGTEVGTATAAAILLHAFADGLNTVSIALGHGVDRAGALRWLALNALAPLAGTAAGLLISLPDVVLGGVLAAFAGMFLALGGGSLLPEAHRSGRDRRTVWSAAGAGIALAAIAAAIA